ncbi:NADH:flavin oxidoreductase/NADH oxidase [uncultured Desulfosarcina sp.]|uniref:NADH:flavin oxidoreductase/NADH oxidase n=1 Tax=uncultured Desulfosarcina sp. TaxID=218289 RepID=UPI0029C95610|nr:NADH:flavin oxidoreductase/NADH oxidase [uncultured Desulfosarcina sp.]
MDRLFTPLKLRSVEFKNRIFVSPMCQYSSEDGMANDWHLVHLGSRAVGGAAMVMVEATAVSPEGRISPGDCGMWTDGQATAFTPITRFIARQNCVPGIQLAHAGRKASTDAPWHGGRALGEPEGGWTPVAPSPLAFSEASPVPREMTQADIDALIGQFVAAAGRCLDAGFQVLELHMAHGYLLHEFLSPLSNRRTDQYGGSAANRMRLPLQVTAAVRETWPDHLPLFVRLSCTDWVDGGWDLAQSIELSRRLKKTGVDLIDCSSAGMVPDAKIPVGPGFQVPLAAAIRDQAHIATGAVGLVTHAVQAEQIVGTGQADAVLLAREMLRDPYWPLHAARILDTAVPWPRQYARAKIG